MPTDGTLWSFMLQHVLLILEDWCPTNETRPSSKLTQETLHHESPDSLNMCACKTERSNNEAVSKWLEFAQASHPSSWSEAWNYHKFSIDFVCRNLHARMHVLLRHNRRNHSSMLWDWVLLFVKKREKDMNLKFWKAM
jgi:hypothetical protein